jgi:hypothetical protein
VQARLFFRQSGLPQDFSAFRQRQARISTHASFFCISTPNMILSTCRLRQSHRTARAQPWTNALVLLRACMGMNAFELIYV